MGDCENKTDEDPRLGSVDRRPTTGNGCHLSGTVLRPVQEMPPRCVTISVLRVGKLRLGGAGSREVTRREKAKPGQGPSPNQQTFLESLQAHPANLLGPPTTPPPRGPPVCSTFPRDLQTTSMPPSFPGARTGITNPLQMALTPGCCTLHWLHPTQPQNPSCQSTADR